jgi:hypothetical protein
VRSEVVTTAKLNIRTVYHEWREGTRRSRSELRRVPFVPMRGSKTLASLFSRYEIGTVRIRGSRHFDKQVGARSGELRRNPSTAMRFPLQSGKRHVDSGHRQRLDPNEDLATHD